MENIFDIIGNDSFFSILSGINKSSYWCIVEQIYMCVSNRSDRQIERVEVRDIVINTIESNTSESYDVNNYIGALIKNGWLEEKYDVQKSRSYFKLTQYAYNFLKFNVEYKQNGDDIKTEELLTSIMKSIEDLLCNNDPTSTINRFPYRNGLKRIQLRANELLDEMCHINDNIKRDIGKIIQTKNKNDLFTALSNYLNEVKHGYISSLYENISITPRHMQYIQQLCESAEENAEFRKRLYEDAYNEVITSGEDIDDDMVYRKISETIKEIRNTLDVKYQRYKDNIEQSKWEILSHASTKMRILKTDNTSFMATIEKILGNISDYGTEEDTEFYERQLEKTICVYKNIVVEPKSLYERRDISSEEIIDPIVPCDKEKNIKIRRTSSNVEQANRYAKHILASNAELSIKDMDNTPETINKLFIIASFSEYNDATYEIQKTGNKIRKGNVLMDEFIIKEKK